MNSFCETYAAVQRPSARAASTSASPGARILPASVSSPTLRTFTCDQRLRGRRGTYFCRYQVSSRPRRCPEIQPQHSPTSTASSLVIDAMPEDVFASLSQTPACSP